ncbi:uncharacterized protein N7515_002082 [Penicillium bovifimosum]|uniref:Uncharacterized protein n=1 Tax=Penicillium bovifimosum TaxID=126998 RepID=A0A9W9L7R1_9EURO|nr:uncharacterized protein N7515_002082 [Penicillium bovifimosum]KAJ5143295.1 hypothetical protein N7515_002082 [Penicillium bovifimosum]
MENASGTRCGQRVIAADMGSDPVYDKVDPGLETFAKLPPRTRAVQRRRKAKYPKRQTFISGMDDSNDDTEEVDPEDDVLPEDEVPEEGEELEVLDS